MDPRYKSPDSSLLLSATDDFRDLQAHTTLLVWLLRLGALLSVAAVVTNWMQLELLSRHFTLAEAQANDLRERVATVSALLVSYACYGVFGRWIVVAHRNLPPLGLQYPEFTPGWALGWFFIPVANFWKPYQAMRQLWKASVDVTNWEARGEHPLLITWWVLWIVSALVGGVTFALMRHGDGSTQLEGATRTLLIMSAVRIPQYVVAWFMVQKIWDAQAAQRRRQLLATASGAPPPT